MRKPWQRWGLALTTLSSSRAIGNLPQITTVSMSVYEMGKASAEPLLRQLREGPEQEDEVKIKGQLLIRESCGADESQRTQEELSAATTVRRILLDKQPDD
jgi:hypothetical protein